MADFGKSINSFKPSHPFIEIEQSLDVMSHFNELGGNVMENPNLCFLGNLPLLENFSGFSLVECLKPDMVLPPMVASTEVEREGDNKRKAEAISKTNSGCSLVTPSETKRKNGLGCVRKRKGSSKEVEKAKEVVHVRARRGQATDSHSLAERVRRERINEKMRCLQDIVPGCCKTMGMAAVLDEIINYVQSLQNQVEFLSMKLSAASSFCDFSLDDMETTTTATTEQQVLPRVGDAYEAQEMEKLMREEYGSSTSFLPTMPY